eukprot:Tbor_TRINITY_DN4898_c0_g1::TRINITY_DN4898_c0_g1_i1::g.1246::m.1246
MRGFLTTALCNSISRSHSWKYSVAARRISEGFGSGVLGRGEDESQIEYDVESTEGVGTSSLRQDLRKAGRRKRSMDSVMDGVFSEAKAMKDKGKGPDIQYIYLKTQEMIYESEHGRKPPSSNTDEIQKYLPFPPDLHMRRLEPLPSEDPWPARAITLENPVLSNLEIKKRDEELVAAMEEREKDGNPVRDDEDKFWDDKRRMYAPRIGICPVQEFTDSIEEHYYWEEKNVEFVREVPLWQRRSLPFLHEHYRILTHRMLRAENRFIHCRDAALTKIKGSASLFAKTEERIDRSRKLLAETHKSLSSPNYNPVRMKKKSLIGLIMSMSDEEYKEWLALERIKKNNLMAEFA